MPSCKGGRENAVCIAGDHVPAKTEGFINMKDGANGNRQTTSSLALEETTPPERHSNEFRLQRKTNYPISSCFNFS